MVQPVFNVLNGVAVERNSNSQVENKANDGGVVTLTIFHTNDIHSRMLESTKRGVQCDDKARKANKCFGGVARIANVVRTLKNISGSSLFLNAGDFFQGTLWYSILKYNIVSAVMANMSYDTVCLGNHEFDDGPAGLVPFLLKMKEAGVTVLGTNLDTTEEPLFTNANITLPKSIIYNIAGTSVAILGVVTTETMTIAKPDAACQAIKAAKSCSSSYPTTVCTTPTTTVVFTSRGRFHIKHSSVPFAESP
ncbi:protein 5NUC-like [Dermacentor andersoni]|uniref:protein 5NUC-like n=1 Tax=Dermacentor andersoni TaxID=34620 RepID=UPI002415DC3B|nr:protein 5NUC-like [Dermacentor andersoni]